MDFAQRLDLTWGLLYNDYNKKVKNMQHQEVFENAQWVTAANVSNVGYVLRGRFRVDNVKQATLRVLGLGFFHCYINGKRVGEDLFLPLHSEYEPRENYPINEKLTSFHTYVPEYDVTDMLQNGENIIAIHFGGGWYTFKKGAENSDYGLPKAIWRIFGKTPTGAFDFASGVQDKIAPSFVYSSYLTCVERHDYHLLQENALANDYDDSKWANAVLAKPLDTDYAFSNCPPDRVQQRLSAKAIKRGNGYTVYDCRKNISGYPIICLKAKQGGQVRVEFAERINESGDLHEKYTHNQRIEIISNGQERVVRPLFTWFGFRYFTVYGDAEAEQVEVVHANVERAGAFTSDNPTLNFIHDAFVQSMLTNMHAGIPSDCPHIERRGYTGDGQLTCHAALSALDAQAFYKKWAQDIADGQDKNTGHIQYTAPYIRSGGGPGGYGCAIVEIPYRLYTHFGDKEILQKYYPQMLKYFDFMDAHSENGLVVSDVANVWCLGDWCTPDVIKIPEPFVNTYFYAKSVQTAIKIAQIIGKNEDLPRLQAKLSGLKHALTAFMDENGDFCNGAQGANAFAVDIGVGNPSTYANLVKHYQQTPAFDTGIFATDVLIKVLFKQGDGALASKLLCSKAPHSFYAMQQAGATTLWEYWPQSFKPVRSCNHHMFGAVVAYFYEYFLGIRAKDSASAYAKLQICPALVDEINRLQGWKRIPTGTVKLAYEKTATKVTFTVEIPKNQYAEFMWKDETTVLQAGITTLTFCL